MDEVKNYFLEKLKKEQAAAEDAQSELSQYGGLMDIGRGLTFNVKNVDSPDAFIKQQQELAGQGSKNVMDQQRVEKTAADQVREALLANLQQSKAGNEIQDQLTRQKLDRDKFNLASKTADREAGDRTAVAFLKNKELDQNAELAALKPRPESKEEQRAAKLAETQQQEAQAIEERRSNILRNIAEMEQMIRDKGTYEMFGAHNANLDSLASDIATDSAKLVDIKSVAMPGEVEREKKNIAKSGLSDANSTALAKLEAYKKKVNERADLGYQVRGLTPPSIQSSNSSSQAASSTSPLSLEEKKRLEFLRANRGR